jgi:tetratricopeptide (TPR) repeat protein
MLYRKHLTGGSVEQARKLREELLKDKGCAFTSDELGNIEDVSPLLVPGGWEAYERGEYETSRMLAERCLDGNRVRSIYALSLLGMSLLWLGDINGARNCIDEVVSRAPGFSHAKLYRAEVALVEGRYREAEADGLEVLKQSQEDEETIAYALGLLERAWSAESRAEHAVEVLSSVIGSLGKSPTFLAYLAHEELKLGHREEALLNIKEALDRAPDHKFAADLMTSIGEVQGF